MLSVCALVGMAGCVPGAPELPLAAGSGDSTDLTGGTDGSGSTTVSGEQVLGDPAPRPAAAANLIDVEPNDDFRGAQRVPDGDSFELIGTMTAGADVLDRDVFDLGPAGAGDHIHGELTTQPLVDIALAVMDDLQRIIGYIDLTTSASGPSTLDLALMEPTRHLYVILATRSSASIARAYSARIELGRGMGVPESRPQIVVLDFQGGQNVRIANRPPVNIPPFNAGVIDPRFATWTGIIVNNIRQLVAADYAGLGVTIYASGEAIPDGPHTTIYFGTYDSQLLGLADNIDPYNAAPAQEAIVYTDTFALFSVLSPDVLAISQVLANTTSHEIGHLLGLRHTADPHDLMDTTATARQMLSDQYFEFATLNPTVLSIGRQDAPSLLSWTLGGTLVEPPGVGLLSSRQKQIETASKGIDFQIPRDRLMSSCTPY